MSEPRFFESQRQFRGWLERNHESAGALLVGFRKKSAGLPALSYREALDEALCFGWIDGVRRRLDAQSYSIRFTPRTPKSAWSAVNIKRAQQLLKEGRMKPSGIAAFRGRDQRRAGRHSYERKHARFDSASEEAFRNEEAAWQFFTGQPAGYRRLRTWWVMSAKRDDTRRKRLDTLIEASKSGIRLDPMKSPFKQVGMSRGATED